MKRRILSLLVVLSVFLAGCTSQGHPSAKNGTSSEVTHSAHVENVSSEAKDTIRIASWNIENFGKSKATDPVRMSKIAETLKGYDIIAVQEISNVREQSDPGCPRNENACPGKRCHLIRRALEKYLNEAYGLHYRFIFSSQVKDERYLFIYNPDTVTLGGAELMEDPGDVGPICLSHPESTGMMVRQPFEAKFKAGDFDFILLTAHTSPKRNLEELNALDYFFRQAGSQGEPDVILVGDLNADCNYLRTGEYTALRGPGYIWVIPDDTDTTVSRTDCAYDRVIFGEATREDFTGRWGVVRDIPDNVSDHYLIWVEFWTDRDSD